MPKRRVVITGLGAITPIGNSLQEYWNGLSNGVSGSAPITQFDTSKFICFYDFNIFHRWHLCNDLHGKQSFKSIFF
jgi:3-oxoacyl-(acyl-carrier-protein) synthase